MNKYIEDLEAFKLDYMFDVDKYVSDIIDPNNSKVVSVDFHEEFEIFKSIYHDVPDLIGGFELSLFKYIVEFIWISVRNKDRIEIESIYGAVDAYLSDIMGADWVNIDSESLFAYNIDKLNLLIDSILNKRYIITKDKFDLLLKHWIINNNIIMLVVAGGK